MRHLVSRHLEHFLALYETGSMRAAAGRRGISQPALTKSLRLREADLGAELFVRTRQGLVPTAAADALYRHARAIDQEARFATMEIRDIQSTFGGRLRLGIGPMLAVSTFPPVLVDFHRQFPGIEVTVETGISSRLADELTADNLDLTIAALPEEPLPARFSALPLFSSRMVAICSESHPLLASGPVGLDDLVAFGRVGFLEDREFEKKSGKALGERTKSMRPVLETTSLMLMFGVLAATDYFAIVAELILPRARQAGLVQLPVRHDFWHIDIDLMCKTSVSGSRPIRVIREALVARAISPQP